MSGLSLVIFCALSLGTVVSWHGAGHMLVAHIAFKDLQKKQIIIDAADQDLAVLAPYSKDGSHRFAESAVWSDDIKGVAWLAFNEWHFYDHYYIKDFTPGPLPDNQTNIVWALKQCIRTLKGEAEHRSIQKLGKSFMLRFLFHLVGDIHQPLHNVSLVNADFPQGDRGGNSFKIDMPGNHDLHTLWDKVLGKIPEMSIPLKDADFKKLDGYADQLMKDFPKSSFTEALKEKSFDKWSLVGLDDAKKYVYDGITVNGKPTEEYLNRGYKRASELIALAGYRLSDLLVEIYSKTREEPQAVPL